MSSSAPGNWAPSSKAGANGSTLRHGSRLCRHGPADMEWYAAPWPGLSTKFYRREHISAGVKKQFLAEEYVHTYQGGVVDDCREHCFSCGILGYFKEQRRVAPMAAWACPSLGRLDGAPAARLTARPAYPALTSTTTCRRTRSASSPSASRSDALARSPSVLMQRPSPSRETSPHVRRTHYYPCARVRDRRCATPTLRLTYAKGEEIKFISHQDEFSGSGSALRLRRLASAL